MTTEQRERRSRCRDYLKGCIEPNVELIRAHELSLKHDVYLDLDTMWSLSRYPDIYVRVGSLNEILNVLEGLE